MTLDTPGGRQRKAADPQRSVWLNANAGSGKTRVLIDRVSRLLFDGVDPGHILCVTYTRAAAAEMQNRLFARLSHWAMASEDDLRAALLELGIETALGHDALIEARRLFAKAVEVPGGLRIQTFHAFAASVLRRFPREAGIAPDFTAMDEHEAQRLSENVLEDMAREQQDAALITEFVSTTGQEDLSEIVAELMGKAPNVTEWPTKSEIYSAFGVDISDSETSLLAEIIGAHRADIQRMAETLNHAATKPTDTKLKTVLDTVLNASPAVALQSLITTCLVGTTKTAKIGKLPTKELREGPLAAEMRWFEPMMARVEQGHWQLCALNTARSSTALTRFAERFLLRYRRAKTARNAVDFSDQITLLARLLNNPNMKDYVLWRLDGQIEHILVDEAQDTASPSWDALQALTAEFSAGQGSHERPRKLFVVGDPKQSIYRFQGADAERFSNERQRFQAQMKAAEDPLLEVGLAHSFRSSPAILQSVDTVFSSLEFPECRHLAFWNTMPGRVDLWPPLLAEKSKEEASSWWEPLDSIHEDHPTRVLAQRLACRLKDMLAGETIPLRNAETGGWDHRPIRARDIMILVQRRRAMFAEVLQACKEAGLPVAGSDRLKLGAELAVRDLMALAHVVATPGDDLSLATVLRSPLFGWSEQQLFTLAAHRPKGQGLDIALRKARTPEAQNAIALLDDLGDRSDFLRPYDLLEHVLIRHEGRAKLLGRLGAEAADGIDALLAEATAYESAHVPSLSGFLAWAEAENRDVKRQFSDQEDLIRIMTVHGAKGLERPIVILPDTMRAEAQYRAKTLTGSAGLPLIWRSPAKAQSRLEQELIAEERAAEEAERKRLLYVAMTRAESWLIVAGAGGQRTKEDADWYGDVARGLEELPTEPLEIEGLGTGQRFALGDWQPGKRHEDKALDPIDVPVPDELRGPPPAATSIETITASSLDGPKALPSEEGAAFEDATAYGSAVHLLLDKLGTTPPDIRENQAQHLLRDTDPSWRDAAMAEAFAVIDAPYNADLFDESALAEVPLSAPMAGRNNTRLHGVIDRLVVTDDHVLIVDFKTNRAVPQRAEDIPLGIVRQMAAYHTAAKQIWPERTITCEILWTRSGERMIIPREILYKSSQNI